MTKPTPIAKHPPREAWHHRSAHEVLGHPDSSATGLSAQEAPPRLAADGPNALKEGKQISPLRIFIGTNETGTLTSGEMRNRPL